MTDSDWGRAKTPQQPETIPVRPRERVCTLRKNQHEATLETRVARKGWRVLDEHVHVDDGISGAEFANRPGFLRLMNALTPRAPFQVLIMSEESRRAAKRLRQPTR
jgi:DNA invertase Pin-like site-specific DNA recombinase